MKNAPHQRSYWVEPNLIGGCYPGSLNNAEAKEKLTSIVDAGVTCVINLMEPNEKNYAGHEFAPYTDILTELAEARSRTIECVSLGFPDGGIPTKELALRILQKIEDVINDGGIVYLHCWGGRGRTGTIVCLRLMQTCKISATNAMAKLQELIKGKAEYFNPTPETQIQRDFLNNWKDT